MLCHCTVCFNVESWWLLSFVGSYMMATYNDMIEWDSVQMYAHSLCGGDDDDDDDDDH